MKDLKNKGNNGNLEKELIKVLPQLLPSLRIERIDRPLVKNLEGRCDFVIEAVVPTGRKQRLLVIVKALTVPSIIRETLRKFKILASKQPGSYLIFATSFISPRVREICRVEGVGYLDLAGNCFLQFKDFYLEKIVDKNPFPKRGKPPSLFGPVSSRIIRAMLEEPQRSWKISELSKTVQVSLGQSFNVCSRLVMEEYLAKDKNIFILKEPGKLLDAWRDQYSNEKNSRYPYYSMNRNPEDLLALIDKTAESEQRRYAVTSFVAANLIAPFVRGFGTLMFYVENSSSIEGWMQSLDLRPVESGPNVILLTPYDAGVFYHTQEVQGANLVGNVQLYLDLYGDPARGREQADFLREKKLRF